MTIGRIGTWAAAGLMAAVATTAGAGTAISITSFNFGGTYDSFAAFDPALGTLKSVRFDLFGDFVPLIVSDSEGIQSPLFIEQSFAGFAGKGFTSVTSPTLYGTIITTGPGSIALAVAPFRNVFIFDDQSEIIGFTADSYGAILSGRLADFLAGGPSGGLILEIPTYRAYAIGQNDILPSLSTFVQGGGTVTYTYETTPGPGPSPTPEPATWALMLAGFGLAGAALRRRSLVPARVRLSPRSR